MTLQWQWRGPASGEDTVLSTLGASVEERMDAKLPPPAMAQWAMDDFQELVSGKLKQFEREQKELGLLLFPQVLQRVACLDRTLSLPGGSMLLCGRAGVGRRSAVSLVAYIHHLQLFSPALTGTYDIKAFRNDLKTIMQQAGAENQPVLLFMEDHHILDNTFLEYINSLLSGGEVPGLFSNEELEGILAPLRDAMASEGFQYASPFDFFTARVRRNLRIVLSMDPTNPLYRERCEANPALYTRCSIMWSENWSRAGLEALPAARLEETMGKMSGEEGAHLVGNLMAIYESMLERGATPRHYCTQVEMYSRIYHSKREELVQQQTFLKSGLGKLAEAEGTVDSLSREANVQQQELGKKEHEANEAMQHITVSIAEASERRKEVEQLQVKLAAEEGQLHEKKSGIENELQEVQPMLDAARKAVGSIKSDNINEIRSLKMPPDAIRDVLEGVLRILGQQDMSWANMKKFLGSKVVKDEIINFDAHKISPAIRKDVDKLLQAKGKSFEHAVIHRVSVAASPLAAWVKANLSYSLVLQKIAPLEEMLGRLTESLAASKTRLVECEEELGVLDSRVVELQDNFRRKTGEAESLKFGLKKAKDTLDAAESLLGKLSGEKGRWVTQVESLDGSIAELAQHALMASAFVTYLPPFPEDVRASVQAGWATMLGLAPSDGLAYDVRRYMSSESEMLTWKAEGLPGDDLSMENGVAILHSTLSPLVIDPAAKASEWLKAHLTKAGAPLEVATSHDPRFGNTLELAVRFGKTLVVTDVDAIPALLYPLLRLDLIRSGPRFAVQLGDKTVDYNEAFRLYLVTRNPEIAIPPDAAPLLSVCNFSITRSGLESQLLGLTIAHEQPELEQQKSSLLKQEEELQIELAALERSLLQSLATSSGNLLENKELLDSLNETKSKSATISSSLENSHRLQVTLDQQRNAYAPIAQRGSTMYFLVRNLTSINHMYQISLAVFLEIFGRALKAEDHSTDIGSRLAVLNAALLRLVYGYVSRYLFNADRLTLGMHMAHHLAPDQFQGEEWDLFVGKLVANEAAVAQAQHQKPAWVPEESTPAYAQLATAFPAMAGQCELDNAQLWGPWLSSAVAEKELPQRVGGQLTAFQALLVVQAFRPDRLQSAMSSFVCNVLGMRSLAPEAFSLKSLHQGEMRPDEPVLFITSPGADPTQELADFADRLVGRNRYHEVAMGQGQGALAIDLLRNCARSGEWLCLKNLHLVVSWLPTLQKEIFNLTPNPEFRLFLTSEPHNKFPASLLENCLKVTFEAPPGLKKNLSRTYEVWTPEYVADGPPIRAQLLFALAWFHAVVQERRTYIPQGWSKFYEFSFADLRSGADIINLGTKGSQTPQWEYLHGLLENAIYGGRVDNPFDLKVLNTYLDQFFSSEVVAVGGGGRVKALPGTKGVSLPSSTHHGDYMALINNLSDTDTPSLFSLPANIDRAAQQANSTRVVGQLKAMAVASSTSAGFSRALWSKQLTPLLKLWDQLMTANSGLRQPARQPTGVDSWGPVEAFVALERTNAIGLISLVDSHLSRLSRVLRGNDSLTPAVQTVGAALMQEEVPGAWEGLWEGPEAPLAYCRAIVARAVAVEQWLLKAQQGQLLGAPLDLGNLFNPITFLNALRQQSARQLGTSVDNLRLVTCWDTSRLRSPVMASVSGLLIQGATFDGARISPTGSDAPTSTPIPGAVFAWIHKEEPHPYSNSAVVPLYVGMDRSKLLAEVQMPVVSAEESVQWTLNGVALFIGL
mmetsp:Transcript_9476/g.27062  ORF Transcript_9476/g.27062 Transcript_9476/m.27062 type:complete len:1740 (-) Transcript_9476:175-5394(-)